MSVIFIHSVQERSWLVRVYVSGWVVVIVRGGESLPEGHWGVLFNWITFQNVCLCMWCVRVYAYIWNLCVHKHVMFLCMFINQSHICSVCLKVLYVLVYICYIYENVNILKAAYFCGHFLSHKVPQFVNCNI